MKTEDWNYETEKVIEFQTIVRMYGFLRHRSPDERGWAYDDVVDWGTARLSYARQHCTVNLCETKPESGGE